MKNNYKVSVIIPCYNAEAFLDRCLGNLLDTDFNDIEIICVNDGSKDNTLKVLKGYAKKHKNIVIIDQKNQGQAVGRNNAVEKATGEYLCFVDSDDFTDPNMMQKMYEVAKKEKSEYVYCDYYEYYGKDNLKLVKNYIVDEPRKNALLANFAPWGKIYKTSFFKKHEFKFLPGKLFEDIAVVPIIASLAKNPVYLPEPLYYYNMENDSSIRRKTYNKKLEDIIYVADYLYEELKSNKLLEKYHDELEYMYLDSILKGGVLRFAAFEEGLEFIPILREKVLKYFPNILKNKYSKKNSLYIRLLTHLSVKASPKFLYRLKRIKRNEKRLLITTENLNMGGVETSLITLLNKIDYKKWDVDLVTLDKGLLDDEVPANVNHKILNINYKGIIPRILKSVKTKSLIKKYKNDKEYDIAIAYYGLNNYSDMYAAASTAKKKYIWVHNDFKSALESSKYPALIKLRNKFMKSKFTYFDKIVSVSENCRINFETLFTGFEDKSISIYNLLNGEKYIEKSKIKTDVKMDEKTFNICSIGRLVKSKQVDKLLELIRELKNKNVKAYIIGDGPEKENLENYIKENNLTDKVVLTGVLTNPYNILKQADLFVSLSKHESLGLVLLESLILDVPVLSYSNDGAKDIYDNIAPENKCILVNDDNMLETLEDAVNKKIKFSKEKFDYIKYNENIKKSYKEILGLDLE